MSLGILTGVVILTAPVRTARAHASLLSSVPADGALVAHSPERIRLVFTEPVVAELSHILLVGSDGSTRKLSFRSDPRDVHALIASLDSLASASYRAEWHIVSADGHPVSGAIAFQVGTATQAAPPVQHDVVAEGGGQSEGMAPMLAGAAVIPAALRGLALTALLALCGLLAFAGYSSAVTPTQMRIAGWLSVAATALFAAHLTAWLAHVSPTESLDASVILTALGRGPGLNEVVRLAFVVLAAWAVLLARRIRLAFVFALAATIAGGAVGHPVAIDPVISIPLKALHLVGVAFWMGGLVWILTSDADSTESVANAGTVSRIALMSISAVTLTGLLQSYLFMNSWTDVVASAYGLTVLAKVAGLIVLGAFGAYHRQRMIPRLVGGKGDREFRASLRKELAVMVAVVMIGGFLAYVPTP